jgi:hypothetical protein
MVAKKNWTPTIDRTPQPCGRNFIAEMRRKETAA